MEPKELLAVKEAAAARLANTDLRRWHLRRVDRRLEQYCKAVMQKPAEHCVWELLAVERFLRLCSTYGLRADYVKIFFRFYESLEFPGATGPTRYKLTPVQCFQFASIFGFWHPDGRRVVREAVLYVPRKFSKTTS
ncbi:MAG: terminase large subunit, partial [Muribaculaceae bacterium]|nr:terminase large subunit [Muribaculaceae bacterium]